MNLFNKFDVLSITKKLRLGAHAKMDVNGTEIDLTELAAIADLTATDLQKIDGITNGTGLASKALVLDSSGNVAMPATGNMGLSRAALAAAGTDATNGGAIATQIVAVTASDGTKGVVLPAAATTAGPILVINTVLTTGASLKVYPVNGGNDQINGEAEDAAFTMGPGEAAWFVPTSATQWYVADHSGNLLTKTEINLLVGLLATAAEINRVADVSTRVVTLVASGAISLASHEGKTLLLGEVGGNALCAMTLPAATGSGAKYLFRVSVANTSNYTITTNGAEVYNGTVLAHDRDITDGTVLHAFGATTQTTITLNGGTTGGQIGDWIELEDILTGVWAVRGVLAVPAGSNPATCFS
jgi:hypothetical protein